MPDEAKRYYKVLKDGRSFHGGRQEWSLPEPDGTPGEWHDVARKPVLCERGFHVTEWPAVWWEEGAKVYLAEIRGEVSGPKQSDQDPTKVSAQGCRLVRELTPAELPGVGIITDGVHEWRGGKAVALGSSQVTAYGSSRVTAYGSSRVTAYGSSQVTAWDRATILRHSLRAAVRLVGLAVEVDWTTNRAEFRRAEPEPQTVTE